MEESFVTHTYEIHIGGYQVWPLLLYVFYGFVGVILVAAMIALYRTNHPDDPSRPK